MRFVIVAVVAIGWLGPAARAQAEPESVALLPLDADQRLEIYGQPVASEVARALVAGGIDVVVVGPKMAVPERARLVLDGTITGKGEAVTLTLRIRDRVAGTVLDSLTATAPSLTMIDSAATELSARTLPAAKKWLATLRRSPDRPADHADHADHARSPTGPKMERSGERRGAGPVAAAHASLLVAIGTSGVGLETLRAALTTEATAWALKAHREPRPIDLGSLGIGTAALEAARNAHRDRGTGVAAFSRDAAIKAVAESGSDLGIAFEIEAYTAVPGRVPMARARVRVRIVDRERVAFDRVIVTDTVVGDRDLPPGALAARVARAVLDILQPNLRRAIPTWR